MRKTTIFTPGVSMLTGADPTIRFLGPALGQRRADLGYTQIELARTYPPNAAGSGRQRPWRREPWR